MAGSRDHRALLAQDRCWDAHTQRVYEQLGVPLDDVILQTRDELVDLCGFIEAAQIRSYLEIGVWTGRLISALHRVFDFDRVAACDTGWAEALGLDIRLPFGCVFKRCDSHSDAFIEWRASLGHVDLVMIDGDHSYQGVRADWEINRRFPHRYIAFHDILGADPGTTGVKRLWDELAGDKREIVHPHREIGATWPTMGIGIIAAGAAP